MIPPIIETLFGVSYLSESYDGPTLYDRFVLKLVKFNPYLGDLIRSSSSLASYLFRGTVSLLCIGVEVPASSSSSYIACTLTAGNLRDIISESSFNFSEVIFVCPNLDTLKEIALEFF